jgi:hypothetical protein
LSFLIGFRPGDPPVWFSWFPGAFIFLFLHDRDRGAQVPPVRIDVVINQVVYGLAIFIT